MEDIKVDERITIHKTKKYDVYILDNHNAVYAFGSVVYLSARLMFDNTYLSKYKLITNPNWGKPNEKQSLKGRMNNSEIIELLRNSTVSLRPIERTGSEKVSGDINIPLKPKNRVRKADGSIRYICGRCNTSFSEAVRCPECGQLVKE